MATPPFQVRTLGIIKDKPLHTSPGTKNDDYMMNIFISGKGFYRNQALDIKIEKPCVTLFLPKDPGILVCDGQDPYHHYYLRYNGAYAKYLTRQVIKKYHGPVIYFENIPSLEALLKTEDVHTNGIFRDNLPIEMGRLESKLALLLTMLLEDNNSPRNDKTHPNRINARTLEAYLQRNLDRKLSLAEMSNHFHLSSRQIARHSKKYFNMSLIQLHEKLKIDLAINLLDNSRLKVNEIALRLGYNDPLHFSRVFKKHHGASPINYHKPAQ